MIYSEQKSQLNLKQAEDPHVTELEQRGDPPEKYRSGK